MVLTVYGFEGSPPCRAVFLTLRALGLEYTLKQITIRAGDTRTPEYLEKNPQHTVPLLEDDSFCLAESRAISTYLVNKYSPDSSLYPKDPTARAMVDSRLYFDSGFFTSLLNVLYPMIYLGDKKRSEDAIPKLQENLQILEVFLGKSAYAAGEHLTLADLALVANVSSVEAIGLSLADLPKVQAWLEKMKKELPYYDANESGAKALGEVYLTKKAECEGK